LLGEVEALLHLTLTGLVEVVVQVDFVPQQVFQLLLEQLILLPLVAVAQAALGVQ
jgi:hypothetical protein